MKKTLRLTSLALVLMMVLTLTSCVPGTAEKAKAKMEKKDYKVVEVSGDEVEIAMGFLGIKGVTSYITATKTVENKDGKKTIETVTALYFEKVEDAKSAMKKVEETAEKEKDEDYSVKRSGKVVYSGTKKAMKDFN